MVTVNVKIQLTSQKYLLNHFFSTSTSTCAAWLGLVNVEKKYNINIKIFLACLNVLVVLVLHGQNCMVNENCLYKAILKILSTDVVEFIPNSKVCCSLGCTALLQSQNLGMMSTVAELLPEQIFLMISS